MRLLRSIGKLSSLKRYDRSFDDDVDISKTFFVPIFFFFDFLFSVSLKAYYGFWHYMKANQLNESDYIRISTFLDDTIKCYFRENEYQQETFERFMLETSIESLRDMMEKQSEKELRKSEFASYLFHTHIYRYIERQNQSETLKRVKLQRLKCMKKGFWMPLGKDRLRNEKPQYRFYRLSEDCESLYYGDFQDDKNSCPSSDLLIKNSI